MNTLAVEVQALAQNISFSNDSIVVELIDGRTITAPLAWFPSLLQATNEQRDNWQLLGDGEGIHWAELDEDLSVAGLLIGTH